MPITDKEKEDIIAKAMETPEGRMALACSMVPVIQDGLDLLGTDYMFQDPTRDKALECLSRYEKNIAKGKIYADGIVDSISDIYDRWDIKRGRATSILKGYIIEDYEDIFSDNHDRFEILDL